MNRLNLLLTASLLVALPGCEEFVPGAGGGLPPVVGSGSVSGSAGEEPFRFDPSRIGATFDATTAQEGDLDVYLCETDCPPLGGTLGSGQRMVTIYVHALQSELRSGRSFTIGQEARVVAHHSAFAGGRIEAVSGEVTIDSSELREGGTTVGTFSVRLQTGETLSGFFEAPFLRVAEIAMVGTDDDVLSFADAVGAPCRAPGVGCLPS